VHGVSRVSSRLGLGFSALKARTQAAQQEVSKGLEAEGGGFIELEPWAGRGPIRVEENRHIKMEVDRPEGYTLRMGFLAGDVNIAAQLMRVFLGQPA